MNRPGPDRYAVIGNPVAHSQSPFIHESFAAQTQQQLRYERLLSPMDGFEATVRAFAAEGGRGCNVTVPFKFEVPALAARLSPRAELAQAANTLILDDGPGWTADNTDGVGLVRDIQEHAAVPLAGRWVLMVGAGGAAAGALGALVQAQPAGVVVLNRTEAKAQELVLRHGAWARLHGVMLQAGALADAARLRPAGFDVVVNASSSSLQGAGSPIAASALAPGCLVVDMMYGPAAEGFLGWARSHGAVVRDGLGMLVEQAAEAFALWRGVRPHTPPVLQALRERLATT